MYIQKRPKWILFCKVRKNTSDPIDTGMRLSFTTHDYLTFIPPNEPTSDFNIHTSISSELLMSHFPKLKPGIYRTKHACCLIVSSPQGISLHGASHQWEKLKELIAVMLSSAGMEPRVAHEENASIHQLMIEWTEVLFALER